MMEDLLQSSSGILTDLEIDVFRNAGSVEKAECVAAHFDDGESDMSRNAISPFVSKPVYHETVQTGC